MSSGHVAHFQKHDLTFLLVHGKVLHHRDNSLRLHAADLDAADTSRIPHQTTTSHTPQPITKKKWKGAEFLT